MIHLTPDELMDAVEGALAPALQTHLESCDACGDEVRRLREVLLEAKAIDVPEPSPLFWDHLSSRVRAAIDLEAVPEQRWLPAWLRWQVLSPIAALALVVMALVTAVPRTRNAPPAATGAEPLAAAEDLATTGEQEWALVAEIVGPLEIDQAQEAGITVNPGDADRIALQLDPDEQRELVRLIREAMQKAGA